MTATQPQRNRAATATLPRRRTKYHAPKARYFLINLLDWQLFEVYPDLDMTTTPLPSTTTTTTTLAPRPLPAQPPPVNPSIHSVRISIF